MSQYIELTSPYLMNTYYFKLVDNKIFECQLDRTLVDISEEYDVAGIIAGARRLTDVEVAFLGLEDWR